MHSKIVYQKCMRKIGVAFVRSWRMNAIVLSIHWLVSKSGRVSTSIHNSRWTCIHHCTPETKQQSKKLVSVRGPAPKKSISAGKVMNTVYWDSCGINHIKYYFEKGRRIKVKFYPLFLDQERKKASIFSQEESVFLSRKLSNWCSKCCPIHCIPEIWPPATFY